MAATLRIHRNKHFRAAVRAVKILVDGKPAGSVHNGEETVLSLEPGERVISLQVFPFAQSPEVKIQANDNQELHYECGLDIGISKRDNQYFTLFGVGLLVLAVCFVPGLSDMLRVIGVVGLLIAGAWIAMYMEWVSRSGIYFKPAKAQDASGTHSA